MHGGEILVPKLPSIRITQLASVMAPNIKQKIIGIRPGEKIYEVMCPRDDAHLTLSFKDYYLIKPSIKFFSKNIDYKISNLKEKGIPVPSNFEYNSENNPKFLDKKEIKKFNETKDYTV